MKKNIKKRYVLKNRTRFTITLVVLTIIVFSFLFATTAYGTKQIEYKVITVKSGDTLWDIAAQYSNGGDLRKYIYEIKKANGLKTSEIYSGEELRIPM